MNYYDRFQYINEDGKALDEYLNEFRDEEGACIYVPKKDWHLFTIKEGV